MYIAPAPAAKETMATPAIGSGLCCFCWAVAVVPVVAASWCAEKSTSVARFGRVFAFPISARIITVHGGTILRFAEEPSQFVPVKLFHRARLVANPLP